MIDGMDVSEALDDFLQGVTLKTVVVTSVDFVETETVTETAIQSVVQPADKDKLNPDSIDWSLDYQMFHTRTNVLEGSFIEYSGRDYKIISRAPFGDYGYYELIGEETKRALK